MPYNPANKRLYDKTYRARPAVKARIKQRYQENIDQRRKQHREYVRQRRKTLKLQQLQDLPIEDLTRKHKRFLAELHADPDQRFCWFCQELHHVSAFYSYPKGKNGIDTTCIEGKRIMTKLTRLRQKKRKNEETYHV